MVKPARELAATLSKQEREQFRSQWSGARQVIQASVFPKGIPDDSVKILEDWYRIRCLYVKEGQIEQLIYQQKEFGEEYGEKLDGDELLVSAVGLITIVMSRN